jgi:hypothetical protein
MCHRKPYRLSLWLGLCLWLIGNGIGVIRAQDAPPIVLVADFSSRRDEQARQTDIHNAIEKVVFFLAAYNPISLVSTCSPVSGTQSPTQDVATLRAALDQMTPCSAFDQAQALQTAVAQLGNQTGDILYLVDGQHVSTNPDIPLKASTTALTPLQATRTCLYVIPIGDASLPTSAAGAIDRDSVQDLVNAAGCGQRYEAQKIPTIASTLLEAALLSQGRMLMMNRSEQLPLFSRATARMNQPISVKEDVQNMRIDVVWGEGALDIALQSPDQAAPTIVNGQGYQSLTLVDPAAGLWNIQLSVTQVPANQVAIVLFSQANTNSSPVQSNTQIPTTAASTNTVTLVASPDSSVLPITSTPVPEVSAPATQVSTEASPEASTSVVLMPISDTQAAPEMSIPPTATHVPESVPAPQPTTTSSLAPIIAAVIAMMGLGSFLLWRRTSQSSAAANPGGTLHSRATAELPPMPRIVNASPPPPDKRRNVQMHTPVPVDAGFGEAQFRQFPAVLVLKNGPQSGQVIEIDSGYFVIGRHSASQLRVQDGTVSREHARIIFDNAQNLYLIENVSQAGTQVNGQFISQRRALYSGDLIQVGNIQIHFQLRVPPSV